MNKLREYERRIVREGGLMATPHKTQGAVWQTVFFFFARGKLSQLPGPAK